MDKDVVYMYIFVCVYVYIYIYMCVDIYMCVYIYIYIHTHTHIHNGKLLSSKKDWNNAICNNMDWSKVYTKQSKSGKEKYHMISHVESKIWRK